MPTDLIVSVGILSYRGTLIYVTVLGLLYLSFSVRKYFLTRGGDVCRMLSTVPGQGLEKTWESVAVNTVRIPQLYGYGLHFFLSLNHPRTCDYRVSKSCFLKNSPWPRNLFLNLVPRQEETPRRLPRGSKTCVSVLQLSMIESVINSDMASKLFL